MTVSAQVPVSHVLDPDAAAKAKQDHYAKQAAEDAKAAAVKVEAERRTLDGLATEIFGMSLVPRHHEAYEFALQVSGLTPGHLLQQLIRTAAATWRQDMLEARGQGGGTTRAAQPTA